MHSMPKWTAINWKDVKTTLGYWHGRMLTTVYYCTEISVTGFPLRFNSTRGYLQLLHDFQLRRHANAIYLDMGFINNWVEPWTLMGWKFRWKGQKNLLIFNSFDILSHRKNVEKWRKMEISTRETIFSGFPFQNQDFGWWHIFGRFGGLIFQKYWLSGHLLSHHCPICLLRMNLATISSF